MPIRTSQSEEGLSTLKLAAPRRNGRQKVFCNKILQTSDCRVARELEKRIHIFVNGGDGQEELLVLMFEVLTSKTTWQLHGHVLRLMDDILKLCSVPATTLLSYVYPILIFLKSNDESLWEPAARLLHRMASLSAFIREEIVDAGGIHYLVDKIPRSSSVEMVRTLTDILYFYLPDQMIFPDANVAEIISVLFMLLHHPDEVVLKNACGIVSCLTNIFNSRSGEVVEAGFIPHLTALLLSPNFLVVKNALQALSNIIGSTATNLDGLPVQKMLSILKKLIQHPRFQKEVIAVLANLLTFGEEEVSAVLESSMVEDLMQAATGSEAEATRILASIAVKNLTLVANHAQLYTVLHLGFIKVACILLRSHLHELVYNGLEILEYILEGCSGQKPLVDTLVRAQEGDRTLERLSRHAIPDIRYLSKRILKMLLRNKTS